MGIVIIAHFHHANDKKVLSTNMSEKFQTCDAVTSITVCDLT